ncbi:hypothetical protein TorRG33x02_074920 [Trema orientale]|uniref:Uncharacterized protein n=1 Tax=Trema orientale TaxID=63057 RepID=A0A2P5FG59_TREOI|nr:hypothetical protein TorRG33x02_074920 [Trema orientale]
MTEIKTLTESVPCSKTEFQPRNPSGQSVFIAQSLADSANAIIDFPFPKNVPGIPAELRAPTGSLPCLC